MNIFNRFRHWNKRRIASAENRKIITTILERDRIIKKQNKLFRNNPKVILTHADTNFDSTHLADNVKKVK